MTVKETKARILNGVRVVDDSFQRNRTANYHLSLQIGLDGISFCIFDSRDNTYLALQTVAFQDVYNNVLLLELLKNYINKHELLGNYFKTAQIAIVNNKATLIPTPLFSPADAHNLLAFNHLINEDEEIRIYNFKNLDAKTIFAVDKALLKQLTVFFPNATINHHSSTLLEAILLTHKNSTERKIIVHIQLTHFEIIVINGKELLFYNSFNYFTAEDFIYYLLFVCEQLKLNPEAIELTLLGEVERNSAMYAILSKYVRNIRFGDRNENFKYSYAFNALPKHHHYNLINQYLCV